MSFHDPMNEIRSTAAAAPGPASAAGELIDRLSVERPTVLAVFAHPDDESFLTGGLLAEVARRGGRVVVVSATAGEHGTDDPANWPPSALAVLREMELRAAVSALGGERPTMLGIVDGTCPRIDERIGASIVGRMVDQVRPDIVLTFGDDGVTGHPDHRAVGRWTRRAMVSRPHIPVVSTVAATAWPEPCIEALHSVDAFLPGHPDRTPRPHDVVVHLDDGLVAAKLAALACHHSQMPRVAEALGPDGWRLLASVEAYRAANTAAALRLDIEQRDLTA